MPCKRRGPGLSPGLAAYFSSVLLHFGAVTARCTTCMALKKGDSTPSPSNLNNKGGSSVVGVTWVCTGTG